MAQREEIKLPQGANMRDVFDICRQHNLPSLAQGMIEFPPPTKLRQIASELVVTDEIHTYRTRTGELDYKESVAKMVEHVYGEKVEPANVLAVPGVAGGVSAALLHLRKKKPDARMFLMEPFYTFHGSEVERAFLREPSIIPVKPGPAPVPDLETLKAKASAGEVDGVIICNPNNPSGAVLTPEEADALIQLADAHGVFLILDECYVDMIFGDKRHTSFVARGLRDNVVVCRGFSKCMGCQSWRCGYAISTEATLATMMQMMDPFYICTSWTQHALGQYFKDHMDDYVNHIKELNALLQGNWKLLRDAFQECFGWEPFEPNGTMYGMFKHKDESDIKACERALQKGVGVCPGSAFFGSMSSPPSNTGWVRIHCGVTREKAEMIASILTSENAVLSEERPFGRSQSYDEAARA